MADRSVAALKARYKRKMEDAGTPQERFDLEAELEGLLQEQATIDSAPPRKRKAMAKGKKSRNMSKGGAVKKYAKGGYVTCGASNKPTQKGTPR